MPDKDQQLYEDRILDHYEAPYHRGPCDHPTHAHEDDNPLCGDVLQVELAVGADARVITACFDGDGCCISQAAASMLMERIEGLTVDHVKRFTAEDMLALFGVRLTPNRQKCCLLAWRVLQAALHSPVEADAADPRKAPGRSAADDLRDETVREITDPGVTTEGSEENVQ